MTRRKLLLASLSFAPVHRLHMEAYRDAFIRQCGPAEVTWVVADEYREGLQSGERVVATGSAGHTGIAGRLLGQRRAVAGLARRDLFASDGDDLHMLVQSTHPANPKLMRRVRALYPQASIRYYLHEPTSWFEKLRKGDSLRFSTAVYLAQWADLRQADLFYVANAPALESGVRAYPIAGLRQRARVLPLPFRDLCPELDVARDAGAGDEVLFLGRANEARCLQLFLETARESARQGLRWRFTLLSGSSPAIPEWATALPNLRMSIGRVYRDEDMASELLRARFVFNLYRVRYTQSGVTPVALMFGVPLIASVQERSDELAAAGSLFFERTPTAGELLDALQRAPRADARALRAAYLALYDVSSVSIPG